MTLIRTPNEQIRTAPTSEGRSPVNETTILYQWLLEKIYLDTGLRAIMPLSEVYQTK